MYSWLVSGQELCQFTRIAITSWLVSGQEFPKLFVGLLCSRTEKTTSVVRDTSASRHHEAHWVSLWYPSDHHSTIVSTGFRWAFNCAAIVPRDANLSDNRCNIFQSGTAFKSNIYRKMYALINLIKNYFVSKVFLDKFFFLDKNSKVHVPSQIYASINFTNNYCVSQYFLDQYSRAHVSSSNHVRIRIRLE